MSLPSTAWRTKEDAAARAEARGDKLIWGALILNIGALVSVSNIVANVSDPDYALTTLLGPMWVFAIGATLGGVATLLHVRIGYIESELHDRMLVYRNATEPVVRAAAEEAILAKTLKIATKMLAPYGDAPVNSAAAAREAFDAADAAFRTQHLKIEARRRALFKGTWVLLTASMAAFLFAFAIITYSNLGGRSLVPKREPTPAMSTPMPPTSKSPVARLNAPARSTPRSMRERPRSGQ